MSKRMDGRLQPSQELGSLFEKLDKLPSMFPVDTAHANRGEGSSGAERSWALCILRDMADSERPNRGLAEYILRPPEPQVTLVDAPWIKHGTKGNYAWA